MFAHVHAHTHTLLHSWVYKSFRLSHKHTHSCAHCLAWVYVQFKTIFLANVFFFSIFAYWAEVRFHQIKYLTDQMMSPKVPFGVQTLLFRFKQHLSTIVSINHLTWYLEVTAYFQAQRRLLTDECTCRNNTVGMVVYLWFEVMHSVRRCVFVKVSAVLTCSCVGWATAKSDGTSWIFSVLTTGSFILNFYKCYLWSTVWSRRRWSLHWGPAVTETLPSYTNPQSEGSLGWVPGLLPLVCCQQEVLKVWRECKGVF